MKANSLNLLHAMNAAAASLQRSARSEAEVLRACREEIARLGLRGGLSLLDETGEQLVVKTTVQPEWMVKVLADLEKYTGYKAKDYTFSVTRVAVYRQVIETRKAVFAADSRSIVTELLPDAVRPLAGVILKSLGAPPGVYAPLNAQDRAIGVLNIVGAGLTSDDVPAVEAFANHIAIALENASLFAAMRDSEQRFRILAEASFEGIALTEQGVIVDLSDQLAQMLGYGRDELIGKPVMQAVAPESRDKVAEAIRADQLEPYEHLALRKDGTIFPIEIRARTAWMGERQVRITAIRDITERYQAEKALRASEEKFSKAFLTSPDSININRMLDGLYLEINQGFTTLTGYTAQDVRGKTSVELNIWANPDDRAHLVKGLRERGVVTNLEAQFRFKDGQVKTGLMSARIIHINDEPCILSITRDITERKQAEEALQQLSRKDEQALRVAKMGHWEFDVASGVFTFNDQYYTLHGTTAQEVGGYQMTAENFARRLVYPEDAPSVGGSIQQAIAATDPNYQMRFEGRILRVDGEARWVTVWFRIVKDAEGNTVKLYGVNQDITERKQAEEALKQYAEQAQQRAEQLATMNEIGRAVSTLQDLDGVLEIIYHQIQRIAPVDTFYICLYDPEHEQIAFPLVYDTGGHYTEPTIPLKPDSQIAGVIYTGKPFMLHRTVEEMRTPPDPSLGIGNRQRKSASVLIVPLWRGVRVMGVLSVQSYTLNAYTDEHAEILTGIGHQAAIAIENAQLYDQAQQEIVERRQAQAEREQLIAELEAKNAELERFAYTVSHDLKTPLVTIRGFLGFVDKDAREGNVERLKTDMARITEATDKMQRLLSELLELSRIGRLMNPPQAVPFEAIVREAVGLVRGRIEVRGVQVDIASNLPTVYGDRARLVEVVQNLMDNAAKFMGDQSNPRIEIGQRGFDADGRPVLFVRDNGIGIEPQYHERVFGLFNKLDAQSEGTGVGLALVKRIVEVHGGRIWVESEGRGKGSTFYFTIPANDSDRS